MRERLCAPSRVKVSLVPLRSNSVPHAISSWMRSGPSSTRTAGGVLVAQAVAGVEGVLEMEADLVLVAESATAMPPWAYCVADSVSSVLARTSTRPAAASSMAARSPAMPAPMTTKSVSAGAAFIGEKW